MLEYIILGFLTECNMSGYDIKQFMTNSTSNFYDASFGSIYPALKRLEEKGYIASKETVEEGKYKKYYEILEPGKKEFLSWLKKPMDFNSQKQEHLVKQFFYIHLPAESVKEHLKHFIEGVKENYNKLDELEKDVEKHADYYKLSTLRFGKEFMRFVIKWYESFLKELNTNMKE
ncbi:MAG: PadR family transcriptional regulator [Bacillota bacterium]